LDTFSTEDPRLYEAAARALKSLLESDKTPHEIFFEVIIIILIIHINININIKKK